jgi:hypothetical protein
MLRVVSFPGALPLALYYDAASRLKQPSALALSGGTFRMCDQHLVSIFRDLARMIESNGPKMRMSLPHNLTKLAAEQVEWCVTATT